MKRTTLFAAAILMTAQLHAASGEKANSGSGMEEDATSAGAGAPVAAQPPLPAPLPIAREIVSAAGAGYGHVSSDPTVYRFRNGLLEIDDHAPAAVASAAADSAAWAADLATWQSVPLHGAAGASISQSSWLRIMHEQLMREQSVRIMHEQLMHEQLMREQSVRIMHEQSARAARGLAVGGLLPPTNVPHRTHFHNATIHALPPSVFARSDHAAHADTDDNETIYAFPPSSSGK